MKPEAPPPKGPKPIRRPFGPKARRSLRGLLTASIAWIGSKASWPLMGPLMETIVERDNLRKALAQVRRNKGAPGVDGMTVDDLPPYLKNHWSSIRSQLLEGTYKPQPVLRVEIPKAGGGTRALGIPTVLDRRGPREACFAGWLLHPAGGAAGAPDGLGSDLLGGELWLSSAPIRAPSGGPGARAYRGRARLGCRSRSGILFRSGEPRHPDGAASRASWPCPFQGSDRWPPGHRWPSGLPTGAS